MSDAPVTLVVGHVTHDRYGDEIVPGGCAYYAAHTHRGLGARVRLVTCVGEDFACEDALAGLSIAITRAGRTTTFANDYAEVLRVQRIHATAPPVTRGCLPPAWRACDVVHLAPVMGEIELETWVRASDARVLGIGIQGWIKEAVGTRVVQRAWAIDPSALAGIDVACVGEEDLLGQGDLLERLTAVIPVIAFTHGRAGCDVIVRGRTTRIGIHPAREVDPTGAGDTFAAAFLHALARGADPVEAARLAAAAASIVVEGRGGDELPRIAQAWARAKAIPVHAC